MLWRLNRYETIIWTDIDQMMFVTEGPLGPYKLIVTGEFLSQRVSNEEMFSFDDVIMATCLIGFRYLFHKWFSSKM